MMNWLRGGNAMNNSVEPGAFGRIRIAFPAFGGFEGERIVRPEPSVSVSREEIARLLQSELAPVKN